MQGIGKSISRCGLKIGILAVLPVLGLAAQVESKASDCRPEQGMEFVCGPSNAEDLVQIPDSKWIVTSGLGGFGAEKSPGALYLLDSAQRTFEVLYPGDSPRAQLDRTMFAECPGSPDLLRFSAHGVALQARDGGIHRLYVTAHGARESVEVFDIDTRDTKPLATWVGCVVLPPESSVNSVAPFPDGGFVVTRLRDNGSPLSNRDMADGKITGFVYEWHPGWSPKVLAGTELSGPNGVVLSPDHQRMYVAAIWSREIVQFSLGKNVSRERVLKLDFNPDNLRWSRNGRILVTGQYYRFEDRNGSWNIKEWVIAEIDPETWTYRHLFDRHSIPGFWAATGAVDTANGFWVGAVGADRLAFISAAADLN